MALKGQGLNALPKTTLDSFVDKSSYNEEIYGDEGENGPPPLDDFQPPETGMGPYSDLTTGHNSETPSARKFIRISDLVGN
jgi:hypothetical protein